MHVEARLRLYTWATRVMTGNSMRLALSGLAVLANPAGAQALPSLGAADIPGSAGLTAVSPYGSVGAPFNPASIASDRPWQAALAVARASVLDAQEVLLGVGIAPSQACRPCATIHVSTREVGDLFDDPDLNDSDLGVEDLEVDAAMAVGLGSGIRAGVGARFLSSTVLGATGDGFGLRAGAQGQLGPAVLGVAYGVLAPRAEWSSGSTGFTVEGTNRLTVGAAVRLQSIGVPFTLAAEYDRDEGSVPADWVRATAGVSLWQTRVQALVGLSDDVRTNGSPRTSECGLLVRVDRLLFGLGARFSSASTIGTTFVFSLSFGGTAPRAAARELPAGNQIVP